MAERCVQTVKAAMKKAVMSPRDINMTLLCLRSTPIDHIIPSPGELLFNRKLVSNLPTKCTNQNFRKGEIQDRQLQRQLIQKRQYDEHAKDLPNLIAGQRVQVQNQVTRRVQRLSDKPARSYIIETPTGQVLCRNRRHLKEDAYTPNTTQSFLYNTTPHHIQITPPNSPNILPTENIPIPALHQQKHMDLYIKHSPATTNHLEQSPDRVVS